MALPVVPVTKPSNIEGLKSSQIGVCHLKEVFFAGVGHSSLNPAAARCWDALVIACLAATKVTLTAVSTADVYRSYSTQYRVFHQRYTPTFDPVVNTTEHQRVFEGVRYYLRKGMIPVASPGGGFHPLGLAVDVAIFNPNINDGDKYPGDPTNIRNAAYKAVWEWLKANVVSLGWSWEHATEGVDDMHLHYFAGDKIPARVLAIEAWIAAEKANQAT